MPKTSGSDGVKLVVEASILGLNKGCGDGEFMTKQIPWREVPCLPSIYVALENVSPF